MGLIRKAASASTLGAVKYTSEREARTKLALEQAKALRKDAKVVQRREQSARRAERAERMNGRVKRWSERHGGKQETDTDSG
jgi:hypothetical protein